MQRFPVIAGLVTICLAMLVGIGATQDAKKDKDDKKETPKYKAKLPDGFSKLGLSKDQREKVLSIDTDYHTKITDLQTKINELKEQRNQDQFKVLTADQRDKYLKSKGVDPKPKDADKDK
jgi:hypothetical protein